MTLPAIIYEYDGTEKTPTPTLSLNNQVLVLNRDYTVTYTNNIEVGTATVTLQGAGNYVGSISKTFSILKRVDGITNIDLTGLTLGTDNTHEHIYEQKYDQANHWQECFICGNKKSIVAHTKQTTGEVTCDESKQVIEYCTSCGYSKKAETLEHVWGEIYPLYPDVNGHRRICTICGAIDGEEECKNENGEILGCKSTRNLRNMWSYLYYNFSWNLLAILY